MCATDEKFKTEGDFIRLWHNESPHPPRRLISEEDKALVVEKMRELVDDAYDLSAEKILRDPILFGDYANAPDELGTT